MHKFLIDNVYFVINVTIINYDDGKILVNYLHFIVNETIVLRLSLITKHRSLIKNLYIINYV